MTGLEMEIPLFDLIVYEVQVDPIPVLSKVLGLDKERAVKYALQIDLRGSAVVATEPKEHAEFHLQELTNAGLTCEIKKHLA